jgi:hypothetical protein
LHFDGCISNVCFNPDDGSRNFLRNFHKFHYKKRSITSKEVEPGFNVGPQYCRI